MIELTKINDAEFCALRDIMYEVSGVKLLPTKKPLVVARLRKRLRDLGINSFQEYLERIRKPHNDELELFVNAITTNETFFYRHPEQFHILKKNILPSFLNREAIVQRPELSIWSAACSSGEEPYSISLLCKEFLQEHPHWRITIFASDINSHVLNFCKKAVYNRRSVSRMPVLVRKTYFDVIPPDATNREERYRLHADIVNSVIFMHHNLLKPFPKENLDIVFLRNAMIYFDRSSKQKAVQLIEGKLNIGGYLFVSLTESLNDIQTKLRYLQMGIYQKQ